MPQSLLRTALVLLLLVASAKLGHAATTPAEKCAAAKRLLAGKKLAALIVCDAKAVAKGAAVDSACLSKATTAFMTAWGKVEGKGGCSTTNDEMATENLVDGFRAALDSSLVLTGFPSTCTAAKFVAAGKKGACKLGCAAKAAKNGLPLSDPTIVSCLSACSTKFSAAFTKAEAKKGGACHTTGDAAAIEGAIDANFVNVATDALLPCPTGLIGCSGACVDPLTDSAHCGGCNSCPTNEGCTNGLCTCSVPPFTLCGSQCTIRPCQCVDLQNDPTNCGGCGTLCPHGAVCVGGVCACPAGQVVCGTSCVDTSTDKSHCGTCGTSCISDPNVLCVNGNCCGLSGVSCNVNTDCCNGVCSGQTVGFKYCQ